MILFIWIFVEGRQGRSNIRRFTVSWQQKFRFTSLKIIFLCYKRAWLISVCSNPLEPFKAVIYGFLQQARVFVPGRSLKSSLMFRGKARAYPSEAPFRCSTLGQAPELNHTYQTRLQRLSRAKHSSLLRKSVNYGCKKFYRIGPLTLQSYSKIYIPTTYQSNLFVCNVRVKYYYNISNHFVFVASMLDQ